MQSMIQSMTSVNRETQEVLIPQFSFSVRFIPHSIRIKCPRWKDIVWLTSRFKSQLSKAKFDKESKSTQHSTLNASPRCIYPTQTCGENTLWGGRPERGEKNVHWGVPGKIISRTQTQQAQNKHVILLWWKHIVGKTPGAGRQVALLCLCDEPLTRWNQSGISDRNRTRSCTACGFLNVTFWFSPQNEMKVRVGIPKHLHFAIIFPCAP